MTDDLVSSEPEDNKIDGVSTVAAILNRISKGRRERLIRSIKQKRPEIVKELTSKIIEFEQVAMLPATGLQALVQEINQKDLVVSLSGATQETGRAILQGLRPDQRLKVQSELDQLSETTPREIEEAQQRLIGKLADLRDANQTTPRPRRGIYV